VAEESRFRTFVSRPVDSDDVVDLVLVEAVSELDFEKRPDSLLLDFFLTPNIVLWADTYVDMAEDFRETCSSNFLERRRV
jgi:hypothetical protein